MNKVVIVVRGGRVDEVFTNERNLDVEILDMDTQDPDKYDELVERYKEITKEPAYHEA